MTHAVPLIPTEQLAREWRERAELPSDFVWGLPQLDRTLPAPWPGCLTVVGAATNTGKTFFMMMMLRAMAEHGMAVFISLEDAPRVIGRRANLGLAHPNFHATFPHRSRLSHVIEAMRTAKAAGAKYIGVDYLQRMAYDGDIRPFSKAESVTLGVEELQDEARVLGLPILLNSQLRRPGMDDPNGVPNIHMLKESGNIENDADFVLMMWARPKSNFLTVEVGKAKEAPVGDRFRFRRGPGGLLIPADEPGSNESEGWE